MAWRGYQLEARQPLSGGGLFRGFPAVKEMVDTTGSRFYVVGEIRVSSRHRQHRRGFPEDMLANGKSRAGHRTNRSRRRQQILLVSIQRTHEAFPRNLDLPNVGGI
jgi:hypothetical protein